jgi:ABC-type cobalamin/Fe3+-siderophores transport system ATPase subunit
MGPNGAGKAHLLLSLLETSEVTDGEISLEGRRSSRISQKKERIKVFSFVSISVEIDSGVSVTNFIRTAINRNA